MPETSTEMPDMDTVIATMQLSALLSFGLLDNDNSTTAKVDFIRPLISGLSCRNLDLLPTEILDHVAFLYYTSASAGDVLQEQGRDSVLFFMSFC